MDEQIIKIQSCILCKTFDYFYACIRQSLRAFLHACVRRLHVQFGAVSACIMWHIKQEFNSHISKVSFAILSLPLGLFHRHGCSLGFGYCGEMFNVCCMCVCMCVSERENFAIPLNSNLYLFIETKLLLLLFLHFACSIEAFPASPHTQCQPHHERQLKGSACVYVRACVCVC